jgi:protoporphyrinogen oxidase
VTEQKSDILILGGGLTGLAAGYVLAKAGRKVTVFERDSALGGISKTVEHNGFRFDLGPHRFFTKDARIEAFVRDLMGDELVTVPRKTRIFLRGNYFDYPLEPVNAVFGMGVLTTFRILGDYARERIKRVFRKPEPVSLEDWVVANFGRTLFDIYFKQYSEKVWGIECGRISAEWVSKRITGMSLSNAVANAFFKMKGKDIPSLVDEFLYPTMGIGRVSEKLGEGIARTGSVVSNTSVERIDYADGEITGIMVKNHEGPRYVKAGEFISSLPITNLIRMLHPSPPEPVLTACAKLKFRDLVIVTIMINRERVTDLTWIYLPERNIPIGRIHEPTNWSDRMAPAGKTLLVTEFFCFEGDEIWNTDNEELASMAVDSLVRLGYLRHHEVLEHVVTRVPKAYPVFEIGYQEHLNVIADYLSRFKNLHTAGRAGMFKYYNMDHAIGSGIAAAEKIIKQF